MNEAFIFDAIRTPLDRHAGDLLTICADDLAASPINALMTHTRCARQIRKRVFLHCPSINSK